MNAVRWLGCWCGLLLSLAAQAAGGLSQQDFGGRALWVYVPATLPPAGTRALVVVLHGGMGNAQRIAQGQGEHALNLDTEADKDGFVVAYLNGTPVTRLFGADRLGWNAGRCCGQSAAKNIDDVGYIHNTVEHLIEAYGIDGKRVYGIGHSNGAMMMQRLMCQTTLFAAAMPVSGPLMTDDTRCPSASGRRILAVHGAEDRNVPPAGGPGDKGISHAVYASEAQSQQVFGNSGASYVLDLVPRADHRIDHIETVLQQREGLSIAAKAARFFGLASAH